MLSRSSSYVFQNRICTYLVGLWPRDPYAARPHAVCYLCAGSGKGSAGMKVTVLVNVALCCSMSSWRRFEGCWCLRLDVKYYTILRNVGTLPVTGGATYTAVKTPDHPSSEMFRFHLHQQPARDNSRPLEFSFALRMAIWECIYCWASRLVVICNKRNIVSWRWQQIVWGTRTDKSRKLNLFQVFFLRVVAGVTMQRQQELVGTYQGQWNTSVVWMYAEGGLSYGDVSR
jgi:hypothetical protein